MKRNIYYFRQYFREFFDSQDPKTQRKIEMVLDLIRYEEQIPSDFFKRLKGARGIYEIRIPTAYQNIRIFCFFDRNDRIIITNCIIKKSRRIRLNDLKLAILLRKAYFDEPS